CYTAYRGRAVFGLGFTHRGAVDDITAGGARERFPGVYLTKVADPAVEAYWRFGAIEHHRHDLLARTVLYDPHSLDVRAMPPRSLVLAPREHADLDRSIAAGELRKLIEIPEIADTARFVILQR